MHLRVVAALLTIGLAACASGSIPNSPAPAKPSAAPIAVPLRVFIPSHIRRRRPGRQRLTLRPAGTLHQLFIAANSAGIKVVVYPHGFRTGAVASLTGDISQSSPYCTHTTNGRTCSFALAVPPGGPYDFVLATFDQPPSGGGFPGSAKQLGAAVSSAKIAKGKTNALHVTVGGVVASTTITVVQPAFFHAIAPGSEQLTINALDADGNVILTDGYVDAAGNAVTVTPSADSAAGSTITFQPAKFSSPPTNGVLLQYSAIAATTAQLGGFQTIVSANGGSSVTAGTLHLTIGYPLMSTTPTGNGPIDLTSLPGAVFLTVEAGNEFEILNGGVNSVFFLGGGVYPVGLTTDSSGDVWFTESGTDYLGEAFPPFSGFSINSHLVALPSGTEPLRITNGPDDALWFTEPGTNAIGRMALHDGAPGAITSYPLPTKNAGPQGITTGPDGALWFAECSAGKIGRIPPNAVPGSSAQIQEFALPGSGAPAPVFAVAGRDGAVWVTDLLAPVLYRVASNGSVTVYPTPSGSGAVQIAAGPDGALWFTEYGADKIARIVPGIATPANPQIFEMATNDTGSGPYGITVEPDGTVFYTENSLNKLVEVR